MQEILVALVIVIIFQLYALKRAHAVMQSMLAELANNPIRHHVDVVSDIQNFSKDTSESLRLIALNVSGIQDEIRSLRRYFVSDEAKSNQYLHQYEPKV